MAYVSFQELATRISHRNTGRYTQDPCDDLLARIAQDENLHMVFYRNVLSAALEIAPDETIQAIWDVVSTFQMPGNTIDGFTRRSVQIAMAGIYDLRIHRDEVLGPILRAWGVWDRGGLSGEVSGRASSSVPTSKTWTSRPAASSAAPPAWNGRSASLDGGSRITITSCVEAGLTRENRRPHGAESSSDRAVTVVVPIAVAVIALVGVIFTAVVSNQDDGGDGTSPMPEPAVQVVSWSSKHTPVSSGGLQLLLVFEGTSTQTFRGTAASSCWPGLATEVATTNSAEAADATYQVSPPADIDDGEIGRSPGS